MILAHALLTACLALTPEDFQRATPESVGMSSDDLIKLTKWVKDNPSAPIFSILIARHDKVVYELYTGGIDPDSAHYLMSVTKSFLSAAIGAAIDRHLIAGMDQPISALLPRALFPSDADVERFKTVTLEKVMGMSALDWPDPPRDRSPEAWARYQRFFSAPNRGAFVLGAPILKTPFQYNDATPVLASAVLSYAVHKRAFDFQEEALFQPMGFRNEEWMHQDPAGLDLGGYGLRVRPIDMLKFGTLYLHGGTWQGKRLLSKAWVDKTFEPWNRSDAKLDKPNYGRFWWTDYFGPGWTAHSCHGWKGQRIGVIADQDLVVTMTGAIEDGSEQQLFTALVNKTIRPSVEHAGAADPARTKELADLLAQVHEQAPRFTDFVEYRMVPSKEPKQHHHPFSP